jgi:hypothetical protein
MSKTLRGWDNKFGLHYEGPSRIPNVNWNDLDRSYVNALTALFCDYCKHAGRVECMCHTVYLSTMLLFGSLLIIIQILHKRHYVGTSHFKGPRIEALTQEHVMMFIGSVKIQPLPTC